MQDEDEGGLVQANQLPHKYNALDFRAPDLQHQNMAMDETQDCTMSGQVNFGSSHSVGSAQSQSSVNTFLSPSHRECER